ncbi:right-handed parallel beta-helix repeat-containing protein, partial [Klebsiella michiganensis]|uniref:right-handed parallel beta-helix repeat-containing protein n=1 Tax=Klebsiella michiganensis TaxID=1134687 RepID=UPI001952C9BC
GILVWRTLAGDDGTMVEGNRIEDIAARDGGSGQNGNAINVYRAGNVTVSGNKIRGCAFSAVRANGAANVAISNNNCSSLGETALYIE